jgi:hypothetical protein
MSAFMPLTKYEVRAAYGGVEVAPCALVLPRCETFKLSEVKACLGLGRQHVMAVTSKRTVVQYCEVTRQG